MLLSRSRRALKLVLLVAAVAVFLSGFIKDALLLFAPQAPAHVTAPVPAPQTPSHTNGPRERPPKLEVNEDGAHPIYELISRAEKDWNKKLEKASKSLHQAVVEYRRSFPTNMTQFTTISNRFGGSNLGIYSSFARSWSRKLIRTLLEGIARVPSVLCIRDVEEFLPPFRAVFSPHDGPNRLSDYGVKSALLQAASSQTSIERDSLPKINSVGWISACSPTSPARRKGVNLDMPPPRPSKKSFIYDHRLSMDPCLKPDHFHHHGQFLSHNSGPSPQHAMIPEFSSCSTAIHHNIRIPTPYGWVEDIYPRSDDPEWDDKIDERLLWRGSNTGIFHAQHIRWRRSHRIFLVEYTNELNGTVDLLLPSKSRKEKVGKPKRIRGAHINPAMMDIGFAGRPISCSSPTCELIEKKFPWRARQSVREAGNYKYVLDVDGNGWSGRFKRLITSNSVIFKSTIYPEWYMDRIAPWVHYVPVQLDLSDLHDALAFFRGDGNGDGAHEDLARNIANAGRQWSKTFWRREDLVAYFFRLILEYSRLMSLDRKAMSYSEKST